MLRTNRHLKPTSKAYSYGFFSLIAVLYFYCEIALAADMRDAAYVEQDAARQQIVTTEYVALG